MLRSYRRKNSIGNFASLTLTKM